MRFSHKERSIGIARMAKVAAASTGVIGDKASGIDLSIPMQSSPYFDAMAVVAGFEPTNNGVRGGMRYF